MLMRKTTPILTALFLTFAATGAAQSDETPAKLSQQAMSELNQFFKHAQWDGVKNMLGGTKAIILAPNVTSGAFIVGMEGGTGLLLVRHGEAWSDPAFVKLSTKSAGFQFGVKESEMMMLVLTRKAVENIVDGVSRIGGTGGFALGSMGVGTTGAGGISGGMEILSVALSEGVSLGSGIADLDISPVPELNTKAYGASFNMKAVLAKPGGQLKSAQPLREELAKVVKSAWYD